VPSAPATAAACAMTSAAAALPPARCRCSSLHCRLCTFQCAFWQAGLQYLAASQPPQRIAAPSAPHCPHTRCVPPAAAVPPVPPAAAAEACCHDPLLLLLALALPDCCWVRAKRVAVVMLVLAAAVALLVLAVGAVLQALDWYAVVLLVLAGVHLVVCWSTAQPRLVSATAVIAPGSPLLGVDLCEAPALVAPVATVCCPFAAPLLLPLLLLLLRPSPVARARLSHAAGLVLVGSALASSCSSS
jgi:hypothetical protein